MSLVNHLRALADATDHLRDESLKSDVVLMLTFFPDEVQRSCVLKAIRICSILKGITKLVNMLLLKMLMLY